MTSLLQWLRARILRSLIAAASLASELGAYVALLFRTVQVYQPIEVRGRVLPGVPAADRSSADRWRAIEGRLAPGGGSCLDVGPFHGYFSRRMARAGFLVLGVEKVRENVFVAEGLARMDRLPGALAVEFDVTPDSAARLPRVDVCLCLSVFHHWVKHHGEAGACRILRALADGCARQFFFETGLPEEGRSWSEGLAFMAPDPRAWIERFFREAGFRSIECIGRFPTHVSSVERWLYAATR